MLEDFAISQINRVRVLFPKSLWQSRQCGFVRVHW